MVFGCGGAPYTVHLVTLCVAVTLIELTVTHIKCSPTLQLKQPHPHMATFLHLLQGTARIIPHGQDFVGCIIGTRTYALARAVLIGAGTEMHEGACMLTTNWATR